MDYVPVKQIEHRLAHLVELQPMQSVRIVLPRIYDQTATALRKNP